MTRLPGVFYPQSNSVLRKIIVNSHKYMRTSACLATLLFSAALSAQAVKPNPSNPVLATDPQQFATPQQSIWATDIPSEVCKVLPKYCTGVATLAKPASPILLDCHMAGSTQICKAIYDPSPTLKTASANEVPIDPICKMNPKLCPGYPPVVTLVKPTKLSA